MAKSKKKTDDVMELFFGLALDMLCVAGFDGYFKVLNPMWTKTLGWTDEELRAKPFLDFVHPDDKQSTQEAAAALGQGSNVISFANRYKCKDGSYRWVMWNSYALVEREMILAVAKDVTELKQSEEKVSELNRDLESRLAEQSEAILELSTPIIKLFDEIVLMPLVGVVDTRRAAQIIENLLQAIVDNEARVAILDITGVPIVDTSVAQHLVQSVNASRMLGAEVVVTGISPATAQTLVKLGIDLGALRTAGSLRNGINEALALVGKQVVDQGRPGE